MLWLENFFLALVGKQRIECPRCHGKGTNGRGDWCWPCKGSGTQVIPRKDPSLR
jgi:DnaJ-class molecular chaperone